jgi:hypothetical protein
MKELKIKNSQIPYYSLSKENSMIIRKMTSTDKAQLLDAIIDFIYEGKETEFENPLMDGIFEATISSTDRLAKSYFSRAESGRTSAKKRVENKANTNDLSVYSSTDDKSIIPIGDNAIDSPETPNNDELTEEQQKKVEEIYNSYSFQTRVLDQIGKKDRENIEREFINILRGNDIYDYNDKVYLELEKTLLILEALKNLFGVL